MALNAKGGSRTGEKRGERERESACKAVRSQERNAITCLQPFGKKGRHSTRNRQGRSIADHALLFQFSQLTRYHSII